MLHCTPFLLFDGNCAEAMTFYHQCLGGELTLTKLGDTPMKAQFPPEKHKRIINAHLKSGALDISATDWMASPALEPIQGNMFGIFVIGGTYDELKAVFDNKDGRLWPNQFVNADLLLETRKNSTVLPTAAILRGQTEQTKNGFRSCMICHLEAMDSFLINMVFSGFSRERKKHSGATHLMQI